MPFDAHKNLAYSTVATGPGPGAAIGSTGIPGTTYSPMPEVLTLRKVTMGAGGGRITNVKIYYGGGSVNSGWRAVVYADASGLPGALLGISAESFITAGAAGQWWTSPAFSVPVAAGPVWIGHWLSGAGGVVLYYDGSGDTRAQQNTSTYSPTATPPNPFGPTTPDSTHVGQYGVTDIVDIVVAAGDGAKFPTPPFNATVWPAAAQPLASNAGIVRVRNISTDTLTIAGSQEGSLARAILVGDQIAATITAKTITDIEDQLSPPFQGGIYPVANYGAVADGATDDSPAIQAAIDACTAAGGGVVQLMRGQHRINTTLTIKTGVWLRGHGPATDLRGAANPQIALPTSGPWQDRMTISDFSGGPTGVGIKLDSSGFTSGGTQLGWPRITVENVTYADAGSHAFYQVASGVIETRFINCVSLRAVGYGFWIAGTDNMLISCTAAQGSQAGFAVQGGNNKFANCKAYGNALDGFGLTGAGRHMLAGCEAQDNVGSGFAIVGEWNALSGCVADTNLASGFLIGGNSNEVDGVSMYGGGGSGYVTKVGFQVGAGARGNKIRGVTNSAVPVSGDTSGNDILVANHSGGGRQAIAYAATFKPDPYFSEIAAMTLTGNVSITNPTNKHIGQKLTFELLQDGTGGRTITFDSFYRTNWTPDTGANKLNIISFEYDGTAWQQTYATIGLTPHNLGLVDNFNRANGPLATGAPVTWITYNTDAGASWVVASNQAHTSGGLGGRSFAVVDAGATDYDTQIKLVAGSVGAIFVWGYIDQNNYNLIYGATGIASYVGGSVVFNQTGVMPPWVDGDVLKVVVRGANVSVYRNGVFHSFWSMPYNLTGTKTGFAADSDSVIFDDFSVS